MPSSVFTSWMSYLFLPLLLLLSSSAYIPAEAQPTTHPPNNNNFSCWACVLEMCIEVETYILNGNMDPDYAEKCNVTGPEPPTCFAFYDQQKKRVKQRGCYLHTANFPEIGREENKVRRCVNDTRTNDRGWTLCTCHSESNCNDWVRKDMVLRNGQQESVSMGVYDPKVPDFLMEVLIVGWLGGLLEYFSGTN